LVVDAPEHVNWYLDGYVTEVLSQGACGSCWAFASITALESLAAIAGENDGLEQYSAQQLVDCDSLNLGCNGGWMNYAFQYAAEYGIEKRLEYANSYSATEEECLLNQTNDKFFNYGAQDDYYISNSKLKSNIARQPITVAVYANTAFAYYESGIMMEPFMDCSNGLLEANHAIVAIGYGTVPDGDPAFGLCSEYWIIKNSWSMDWGEQGIARLCMDGAGEETTPYGICHINSFTSWPVMNVDLNASHHN
jgi:C1A family cysteine protease